MGIHTVLKEKRKEFSFTQEELAEKILVSPKTISNWENGKTSPDLESLVSLAKLFDFSLDELLLEDSKLVAKMNDDLKRGRNIFKFVIGSVLITVFLCTTVLFIYEEHTKHYREQYEEYIRNQYILDIMPSE